MEAVAIAPTPNIGPRGRKHRRRLGLMAFGVALLVGGVLFGLGVTQMWRLALFPFLWVAALGFFQARDKT